MIIETKNMTIEINADGTVEYTDEATTENFENVEECSSFLRGAIESGSGEWWVSESKELLEKLADA